MLLNATCVRPNDDGTESSIFLLSPEHAATNSQIPDLPIATETVAHGGQTELKVFVKKFTEAPNLPASGDQVCS